MKRHKMAIITIIIRLLIDIITLAFVKKKKKKKSNRIFHIQPLLQLIPTISIPWILKMLKISQIRGNIKMAVKSAV